MNTTPTKNSFMIAIMVAAGAFMFSSKGILVKALYAEGFTPTGVLAIRMGIALPFYLIPLLKLRGDLKGLATTRDWVLMVGLSFVGYFMCSWINFTGLQYISVGLERVIMFCYPPLVLIGSAVFQKQRPTITLIAASALSWAGLYLVLKDEIQIGDDPKWVLIGSGMILISAIIYAGYILVAKPVIIRIGASSYTSITMCFSCIFILVASLFSDSYTVTPTLSPQIVIYGALIGIFGTVVPTYILSYGLSKMKPTSYAIVSSAGPVGTILLSMAIINQTPNTLQMTGITLSVIGSLLAIRK